MLAISVLWRKRLIVQKRGGTESNQLAMYLSNLVWVCMFISLYQKHLSNISYLFMNILELKKNIYARVVGVKSTMEINLTKQKTFGFAGWVWLMWNWPLPFETGQISFTRSRAPFNGGRRVLWPRDCMEPFTYTSGESDWSVIWVDLSQKLSHIWMWTLELKILILFKTTFNLCPPVCHSTGAAINEQRETQIVT